MKEKHNNNIKLKECSQKCLDSNSDCKSETCEYWINFREDNNCDLISIKRHGQLTLRQVGERLGISYVRVKQIEDAAIKKIKNSSTLEILED